MNILIVNGNPRKKGLIVATIERSGTAMHPQLSEKDKQKCHKAIRKI